MNKVKRTLPKRKLQGVVTADTSQQSKGGSPRKGKTPTVHERTVSLWRGLEAVLDMHQCPKRVLESARSQICGYLDTFPNEDRWLTAAKHLLASPMAKYLRNPPPPAKENCFVAKGCWRRWASARLCAYNHKNTHLWFSWLQCKRAAEPASDDNIQSNYDKHFNTLSRPPIGDPKIIDQVFKNRDFQRVLRRVNYEIRCSLQNKDYCASNSSTFKTTRSEGGAHAELRELSDRFLADNASSERINIIISGGDLRRMKFKPRCLDRDGNIIESRIVEERHYPILEDNWRSATTFADNCPYGSLMDLQFGDLETYRRVVGELTCKESECLCREMNSPGLNCTIQGIIEPFKVRVISKGPALSYYAVKGLQKTMHTVLRKMNCFHLIGQTVTPTSIIDIAKMAREGDQWFSVDYSAATDGLDIRYSEKILNTVLRKLPGPLQQLASKVLGPHFLHYPDEDGKVHVRGKQMNGQLMGSPLSFPILCLANLGLYLSVTEELHRDRGWNLRQRLDAVLANGDDMLYAAPPALVHEHIRLGHEVGLEFNVGKSYVHRRYANINSLSLDCPLPCLDQEPCPKAIPFFNVGLFFGQNKVLAEEDRREKKKLAASHADPEVKDFTSFMNHMLAGFLPAQRCRYLALFLKMHRVVINQNTKSIIKFKGKGPKSVVHSRNLFLPIRLGGMGVHKPTGFKSDISQNDKRVAYSLCSKRGQLATQYPLPGNGKMDAPQSREFYLDPSELPQKLKVFHCTRDQIVKKIWDLGQAIPYRDLLGGQPYELPRRDPAPRRRPLDLPRERDQVTLCLTCGQYYSLELKRPIGQECPMCNKVGSKFNRPKRCYKPKTSVLRTEGSGKSRDCTGER